MGWLPHPIIITALASFGCVPPCVCQALNVSAAVAHRGEKTSTSALSEQLAVVAPAAGTDARTCQLEVRLLSDGQAFKVNALQVFV